MTWLADAQKDRPDTTATIKLLAQREDLVKEVQSMKMQEGLHRSNAARQGWIEDMTKIAKKIANIDKKLGRI